MPVTFAVWYGECAGNAERGERDVARDVGVAAGGDRDVHPQRAVDGEVARDLRVDEEARACVPATASAPRMRDIADAWTCGPSMPTPPTGQQCHRGVGPTRLSNESVRSEVEVA